LLSTVFLKPPSGSLREYTEDAAIQFNLIRRDRIATEQALRTTTNIERRGLERCFAHQSGEAAMSWFIDAHFELLAIIVIAAASIALVATSLKAWWIDPL
jgi:hypothetical protein